MLDTTPQERLALIVLAVLLTGGAGVRYTLGRAQAVSRLEFSAEAVDTLSTGSSGRLRAEAEAELALQRIRSTPLGEGERIDPNAAAPEQLARLPRIGPALANRIVAHREASGPFRSAEDLRAVPGIGPALLEGIAPHLTLVRRASEASGGTGGMGRTAGGSASVNPGSAAHAGRGGDARVDVNRASAAELEALPGIGPAIAQRIVEYRQANGRFGSLEDLENVSGIGPRLRERIEPTARLGP